MRENGGERWDREGRGGEEGWIECGCMCERMHEDMLVRVRACMHANAGVAGGLALRHIHIDMQML